MVAEYLAERVKIADPLCLKLCGDWDGTARTHAGEIQEAKGWRDLAEAGRVKRVAGRAGVDDRRWAEGAIHRW